MTKKQLIDELKKAGPVYVGVRMHEDDIVYVKAVRSDVLDMVKRTTPVADDGFIAERLDDGLYIG